MEEMQWNFSCGSGLVTGRPDQSYLSVISRDPPANPIILLISSHYLGTGRYLQVSITGLSSSSQFVSLPPPDWLGLN